MTRLSSSYAGAQPQQPPQPPPPQQQHQQQQHQQQQQQHQQQQQQHQRRQLQTNTPSPPTMDCSNISSPIVIADSPSPTPCNPTRPATMIRVAARCSAPLSTAPEQRDNLLAEPSYARCLTQSVRKVVQAIPSLDAPSKGASTPALTPTTVIGRARHRLNQPVVSLNRIANHLTSGDKCANATLHPSSPSSSPAHSPPPPTKLDEDESEVKALSDEEDDDDDAPLKRPNTVVEAATKISSKPGLTNGDDRYHHNHNPHQHHQQHQQQHKEEPVASSRSLKRKLSPCGSPQRNGNSRPDAHCSDTEASETSSTCRSPTGGGGRTTRSSKRVSKPTDFFDESLVAGKLQAAKRNAATTSASVTMGGATVTTASSAIATSTVSVRLHRTSKHDIDSALHVPPVSANDVSDLKPGITPDASAELPTCEADTNRLAHHHNSVHTTLEDSLPISELISKGTCATDNSIVVSI